MHIGKKLNDCDKTTGNPKENNVPIVGEPTTDAEGNSTSVGKEGFRSNAGDGATITYRENGGNPKPGSNYRHPVIQTQAQINENALIVNKEAKVDSWNDRTYNITISAHSNMTGSTTTTTSTNAEIMMVLDMSASMCLNAAGDNTVTPNQLGKFGNVKGSLDPSKVYYRNEKTGLIFKSYDWGNGGGSYNYLKYPMICVDGVWMYFDETDSTNVNSWHEVSDDDPVAQWDSRITTLKEETIKFIKSQSAKTKVGVVRFDSSGTSKRVANLAEVGNDSIGLIKKIAAMQAGGGTYMAGAMEIAKNDLANSKVNNPNASQYVVAFCDGEVTDGSSTETQAGYIKDNGVTIYSIGFAEGATGTLKNIATDDAHYVNAKNTSELNTALGNITTEITQNSDITGATVTDVIDPRFELVDGDGNVLKEGDVVYEGGTVKVDGNGNQYIEWTEQTIPNPNKPGATATEWTRTIKVKAKDNFIGGNNVATNVSPDSKITITEYEKSLPLPHVNVRELHEENKKEVTIYKGDKVPTDKSILDDIFDLDEFVTKYNLPSDIGSRLRPVWYEVNGTQETVVTETDMANESPDSDKVYRLKVFYDAGDWTPQSDENTTTSDGTPHHVGEDVNGTHKYEVSVFEATYTVKVVPGELAITKTLTEPATDTETFTFTVKKLVENLPEESTEENGESEATEQQAGEEEDSQYKTIAVVTVTVEEGHTTGEVTKVVDSEGKEISVTALSGLERGEYVITENERDGYALNGIEKGSETNCENASTAESITFTLGNGVDENNVIVPVKENDTVVGYEHRTAKDGVKGVAAFTNEPVTDNWRIVKRSSSDTEAVLPVKGAQFELKRAADAETTEKTYIGTSNDDGEVVWNLGEGEKMEAGVYTLTETNAPAGYLKSEETWTITISSNGSLKEIRRSSTTGTLDTVVDSNITSTTDETNGLTCYFYNVVAYELPSTGGSGIYWYSIGGMLMMCAAVLILYRTKTKQAGRCRKA